MPRLTRVEGTVQARGSARAEASHDWRNAAVLAVAFGALYLLLLPGNRSETDDGYGYAYQVRSVPWSWDFDPQHALLVPLGKLLSGFTDPYATLVALNFLAGLGTILLFFWTLRSLDYSQQWSLLGASLLGASYGFWRYSVEAETYTIATATALLLLLAASRRWPPLVVIALSVVALLGHLVNIALVLVAVPVLLWRRGQPHVLGWYLFAAVPASLGLLLLALGSGPPIQPAVVQDLVRLPVGIGQSVVAANGLLGLPGAADFVSRVFGGRDLTAEVVLAQASAGLLAWAAALTLVTLLATALVVAAALARGRQHADSLGLWVFGSWLAAYALPAVLQERGNPEMWIIATVPLWGLVICLGQRCGPQPPRSAYLLATVLLVHTVVAGLLPVHSRDDDVNYQSSLYLREHAPAGSLVVTNDNQVLTRYLRYELPVTVLNLNSQQLPDDLSAYPAVFVMPSAADEVPYDLVSAGDVYRVVGVGSES